MKKRVRNTCSSCGKKIPSGLSKCLACTLNLKSGVKRGSCKCLVCGTEVSPSDDLCKTCGTNFQTGLEDGEATDGEAEEFICMICGKAVDKKARRCEFCGTIFVDETKGYTGPVVERISKGAFGTRASPNPG
jgi:hypothetical protein